jgi:hypothetical protein
MKIFQALHNQNSSPTLVVAQSEEDAISLVKEYLLHTQQGDENDIVVSSVIEVDITEDVIQLLANQYAESESSCFTNDMYGYLNGFKQALSILNPTLFKKLFPQ